MPDAHTDLTGLTESQPMPCRSSLLLTRRSASAWPWACSRR